MTASVDLPVSDPGSPWYWPEHPTQAVYGVVNTRYQYYRGWTVHGVPPSPWPTTPDAGFDRATYGPPGTYWLYSVSDALEQISGYPIGLTEKLTQKILSRFKLVPGQLPSAQWFWVTPDQGMGYPMSVQVVRATVHAKLGANEEVAHVLHFARPDGVTGALDAPLLDELGPILVANWSSMLDLAVQIGGTASTMKAAFAGLTYDYIALASITLAPPAKPHFDVRTRYYNFDAGHPGATTGTASLPWEVASAQTLTTNQRGGRYRGRTFLGPFIPAVMDGTLSGKFQQRTMKDINAAFFFGFVFAAITTGSGVAPVIASYKYGTAEAITGTRVGLVPDAMRSRRASQSEDYVLNAGS